MTDPVIDPIPTPDSSTPQTDAPTALPQTAEEEPLFMLSGRKRKTIWPFIVIPLVCVLILGGIFTVWYTHPKTVICQTLSGYARTWLEGNGLINALGDALDEGQIHLELSNAEISPTPLRMDLYTDAQRGTIAQISAEKDSISIYATKEALMVGGSPLGDTVYGIRPQGLYQQFEASIFHPHAEGKYAVPLFEYQLSEMRRGLTRLETLYSNEPPETDFANQYYKRFIHMLLRDAEVKTVDVNGNRQLQITLSPEVLENAIYSFCRELTSDTELIAYLDTYAPMDPATNDFNSWTEEFEWLMEKADQLAESCRTRQLTLNIRMEYTPFTRRLQSLTVSIDRPDQQKMLVALDARQEGSALLSVKVESMDVMELLFTQTPNEFRVKLDTLNIRGAMGNLLDLHYLAQESGAYQLVLKTHIGTAIQEWSLHGSVREEKGLLRFTADHAQYKAAGVGSITQPIPIGLTVELRDKAEMPQLPKDYKDILSITEGEMDDLAAEWGVDPNEIAPKLKELYERLAKGLEIS